MSTTDLIGFVEVVLSFLECAVFVVLYAVNNRWWHTETGIGFMLMMAVFAAVLGLSVIKSLFVSVAPVCGGGMEWFTNLRLAVFSFVPVALAWPIKAYIRVLWRRAHNRETS